jgi:hypothetical protein
MKQRRRVTRARLRELLDYNSNTGEFTWKKRLGNYVRPGRVAGHELPTRRMIGIDGRVYPAHRLAWIYRTGRWGPRIIDHRDGDPKNNRLSNLRRATQSQNCANRRLARNNTSGFKGVSRRASGKWLAYISKNGRKRCLGRFETPEAAHEAYMAAAHKLFGKFARSE